VVFGEDPTALTIVISEPHWSADHPDRLSYCAALVGDTRVPASIVRGQAALFIDDGGVEDEELMM
jgi:hypothetical protein